MTLPCYNTCRALREQFVSRHYLPSCSGPGEKLCAGIPGRADRLKISGRNQKNWLSVAK